MLFFLLTIGPAFCFACGNILEKSGISKVGKRTGGVANPMMVLNPVLTALMGFWLLKEKLTKRIIIAICFVVAGLTYSVETMGEATGTQNVAMLWSYAGILSVVTLFVHLCYKNREIVDSLIMGMGFGLSAVFYKSMAMDFDLDTLGIDTILGLLLDARLWGYVATYSIAFLYSQVSFSRGRALFIVPFSAAVGAAVPTLGGGIVFAESFPLGKIVSVSLVLIGAALFVVRRPRKNSH